MTFTAGSVSNVSSSLPATPAPNWDEERAMETFPNEEMEVIQVKKEKGEAKRSQFKPTSTEKGMVLQHMASRPDNNFLVGKRKMERKSAVLKELKKKMPGLSLYALEQIAKSAVDTFEEHVEKEAKSTGGGLPLVQDLGNSYAAVKKIYEQCKQAQQGFFRILDSFLSLSSQPRRSRRRRMAQQRPALHED